jgi:putative hydrolase of the HAD superfamily
MSVLIFDADDTLWENNIYFEHAFDDFVEFLGHSALTPAQVREVLNEIELVNSKIHGYGPSTSAAICSRLISIWPSGKSVATIWST